MSAEVEERRKRRRRVAAGAAAAAGATAATTIPVNSRGLSASQRAVHEKLRSGARELTPQEFAEVAPRRGARVQNNAYTARMARAMSEGKVPDGATTLRVGRNSVAGMDGAHRGHANAMLGRNIPVNSIQLEQPVRYKSLVHRTASDIATAMQRRRVKRHASMPAEKLDRMASRYRPVSDRLNALKSSSEHAISAKGGKLWRGAGLMALGAGGAKAVDELRKEHPVPIVKVQGGYRWGNRGKVYPTRAGATRQARAAYANGYVGKSLSEVASGTGIAVDLRKSSPMTDAGLPDVIDRRTAERKRRRATAEKVGNTAVAASTPIAGLALWGSKYIPEKAIPHLSQGLTHTAMASSRVARRLPRPVAYAGRVAAGSGIDRKAGKAFEHMARFSRKYPRTALGTALGLKATGLAAGTAARYRAQEEKGLSQGIAHAKYKEGAMKQREKLHRQAVGKSLSEVASSLGVAKAAGEKQDKGHARGAALGLGTTAMGAGLVAGGIPGTRPDATKYYEDVKRSRAASRAGERFKPNRRELMGQMSVAGRGGIFGYREDAHKRTRDKLQQQINTEENIHGNKLHRLGHNYDAHKVGAWRGARDVENRLIRQMGRARKVSNVITGAGLVTTASALGAKRKAARKREEANRAAGIGKASPKERMERADRSNATALGTAGLATAAASQVGGRQLERIGRREAEAGRQKLEQARMINPNIGGYEKRRHRKGGRVPDFKPYTTVDQTAHHPTDLAGQSRAQALLSGRLRGEADKHRYFAHVYGSQGKGFRRYGTAGGLAVAGAAALGQKYKLQRRNREKRDVAKSSGMGSISQQGAQGRAERRRSRVSKADDAESRRRKTAAGLGYAGLAAASGSAGSAITGMKWAPPETHQRSKEWIDQSVASTRRNAEGMGRGKPTVTARALGSKHGRELGDRYIRTANLLRKYPGRSAVAAGALKATALGAGVKAWHKRQEVTGHSEEIARNRYPNVAKAGDWRTIKQREESKRNAKRFAHASGSMIPLGLGGVMRGATTGSKPLLAAGTTVAGVGAVGAAAGHGTAAYHQARINARRRANLKEKRKREKVRSDVERSTVRRDGHLFRETHNPEDGTIIQRHSGWKVGRDGRPVKVGKSQYQYLLPNIQAEAQGVRRPRVNPISPLDAIAASDMVAEGVFALNAQRPWPFNVIGRRKRTRNALRKITTGSMMMQQGIGGSA